MTDDRAELPQAHKAFYDLREMALLIALRVNPEGEAMRTTVDKVRKRLMYAVKQDELHLMGPPVLQLFFAAQVFAWARKKWPEALGDIPVVQSADVEETIGLGDEAQPDVIPGDLIKCQEALRIAQTEIHRLQRNLEKAEREIDRLQPLAERYEEIRLKNQSSAKRPRTGI
ncbi:hypothetical protein ACFPN1_02035 [Lysobacter yangpyeongensis]|uniref:Uncharacterized protein n=1 Tax=Lysobacter yangpyeongensis TaxID=346182 RepID=A0ABW0SIT6_9GAMM